jgi:hypothetical protein
MQLILDLLARDRRWRDGVLFVSAGLIVIWYLIVGESGFPLDDSWIHQVYARNLAEAGQWAFIPGQPSGASTSPLYTLLLAVGYALNIDFMIWTHLLGWLALGSAGVLVARCTDLVLPHQVLVGWCAGFAVVFAWHLVWAAVSGMETMLFCTLTLGLIYLAWRESRLKTAGDPLWRGAGFGVLTAALIATRPEGALLAAFAAGLMLIARPQERGVWRLAMGAGIAFAVGITPYLLLNLSLNGELVPNTSAAKQAQHAPLLALPYVDRLLDMILPLLIGVQVFLLPGVIILSVDALIGDRRKLLYLLPLAWAVGLIMLYAARLPASYQHGRYVIPALPGLILAGVIGLAQAVQWGRSASIKRVGPLTLAFSAGALLLVLGWAQGPTIYRTDQRVINDEMVAQAQWIAENLPPEDGLLAVHDIGALGYFAPRPVVDIAGLVTPEIVEFIGQPEAMWGYIQARGAQFMMAFPDQLPDRNPDDPRLCFFHESDGTGSTDLGGPKMTLYRLAWDGDCPD